MVIHYVVIRARPDGHPGRITVSAPSLREAKAEARRRCAEQADVPDNFHDPDALEEWLEAD